MSLNKCDISADQQREFRQSFLTASTRAAQQEQAKSPADLIKSMDDGISGVSVVSEHMGNLLGIVGLLSPFFNSDYLRQEGHTDVDSIDWKYILVMGNQILKDHQFYSNAANEVIDKVNQLLKEHAEQRAELNPQPGDDPNVLNDRQSDICYSLMGQCLEINELATSWIAQYTELMCGTVGDVISHINLHRAENQQLINPFLGETK